MQRTVRLWIQREVNTFPQPPRETHLACSRLPHLDVTTGKTTTKESSNVKSNRSTFDLQRKQFASAVLSVLQEIEVTQRRIECETLYREIDEQKMKCTQLVSSALCPVNPLLAPWQWLFWNSPWCSRLVPSAFPANLWMTKCWFERQTTPRNKTILLEWRHKRLLGQNRLKLF